jgi:hypothetical protein
MPNVWRTKELEEVDFESNSLRPLILKAALSSDDSNAQIHSGSGYATLYTLWLI